MEELYRPLYILNTVPASVRICLARKEPSINSRNIGLIRGGYAELQRGQGYKGGH